MDIVTLSMAKSYCDSKGGYSKPCKVLLAVQTDESGNAMVDKKIGLEVGQSYNIIIKTGGQQFSNLYTAVHYEEDEDVSGILVGDGELVAVVETDDGTIVATTASKAEIIIEQPETIVPIDPKFLPPMGGGLEVVELTTIIDSVGNTEFTAEEKDAFHKAETESPVFIICFNYGGTEFAGVTARAGQGGIYGHTVQTPIGWFSFFYVDGMLSVTIEQNA